MGVKIPGSVPRGKSLSRTEIIAGLDVGTTKTCMVIAEIHSNDRIDIIGEGLEPSRGIQRGVVVDIDATSQAIRQAADKAEQVAGAQVTDVFIGVTGEHVSSMNSKGIVAIPHQQKQVQQEDVDRAVKASCQVVLPPDRDIIHSIPRGFCIDGQNGIQSPVGMSGSRLEVETHIVHGVTTFIQNLAKCVDKSGLHIEGLVLQSVAAAQAVLTPADRDLGVAVVDIGGGTTDIAMYTGGNIAHSAVIGVGGNHVTQDLAVGLQCSLAEAERVKIVAGALRSADIEGDEKFSFMRTGADQPSQLPKQLLVEIIEPRMSELLQFVEDTLTRSGCRGRIPGGIVLTGGASLMRGLVGLAEQTLGMPVRMGKVTGVGGISESVSDPIHATAVGLAIYGARQDVVREEPGRKGLRGSLLWLKDLILGSNPE